MLLVEHDALSYWELLGVDVLVESWVEVVVPLRQRRVAQPKRWWNARESLRIRLGSCRGSRLVPRRISARVSSKHLGFLERRRSSLQSSFPRQSGVFLLKALGGHVVLRVGLEPEPWKPEGLREPD